MAWHGVARHGAAWRGMAWLRALTLRAVGMIWVNGTRMLPRLSCAFSALTTVPCSGSGREQGGVARLAAVVGGVQQ
jgi:hypothetical protein